MIVLDVADVDDSALSNGSSRHLPAARQWGGQDPTEFCQGFSAEVLVRSKIDAIILDSEHPAGYGLAQPGGTRRDSIEYGLHVRRRLTDHAEDLAGRRLLLQCLRLTLQRRRKARL